MQVGRGDALAWRGFIVIIDENTRGKCAMLFDPVTGTMTDLVSTEGQHVFGAYAIVDDVLYCTGGLVTGFQPHDLVHWASLSSRDPVQWHFSATLPCSMSHHSCIVLAKHLQPSVDEKF